MKNFVPIAIFLVLLMGCDSQQVQTYEAGYFNCKKVFEDNGGTGIFPPPSCLVGSNLPDFKAVSTLKESITTNSLKGKPTVINFWFVGCPPCEAEVPGLNKLADRYNDEVNFVAIGRNSDKYLKEFLEVNEWNFKHVNDPDEILMRNSFKYVWGFPTTFIADSKGTIVKAFSGGKMDSMAVDWIINEIEPTLTELISNHPSYSK